MLIACPNRGIAWWFDAGPMTLGCYSAHTNFPDAASPGPDRRGKNFLLGGLGPTSVISQTIDLSALAAEIDDPGVDYVLSGWLGGRGEQSAAAQFTGRFLTGAGVPLSTNRLGPVTAADRTGVTGLLKRFTTGQLPTGTRLVEFTLSAQASVVTNDASADNLSFVLTPRTDPSFRILNCALTDGAWRVEFESRTNRLYSLERSPSLDAWKTAGAPVLGSGAPLALSDPNPPPGRAFYRIRCQRP